MTMKVHELHPEDVRAEIRKRFGTITEFEKQYALPAGGVRDILRGRTSARVVEAVESVLIAPINTKRTRTAQPQKSVNQKRVAA
jgi:hypothetical protein